MPEEIHPKPILDSKIPTSIAVRHAENTCQKNLQMIIFGYQQEFIGGSETTKMVFKKEGLISIIVGILIPSILYPFTQLSGSAVLVQTVMPQNGVNSLYRWRDL